MKRLILILIITLSSFSFGYNFEYDVEYDSPKAFKGHVTTSEYLHNEVETKEMWRWAFSDFKLDEAIKYLERASGKNVKYYYCTFDEKLSKDLKIPMSVLYVGNDEWVICVLFVDEDLIDTKGKYMKFMYNMEKAVKYTNIAYLNFIDKKGNLRGNYNVSNIIDLSGDENTKLYQKMRNKALGKSKK